MRKTDRSLRTRRAAQARLFLETLEDRTLLSVGLDPDALNRNTTAGFGGNQTETTIAVNPNNANQIFTASNAMTWRFSNDAGVTWNNSNLAGLPAGCCDNQATWDRHGNLFVVYLKTVAPAAIVVARSVNGGANWAVVLNVGGTGLDQPSIDTGPGAAGSGFSDAVCVSYRDTAVGDHIAVRCAGVSGLGAGGAFTGIQRAPGSNGGNFGDIAIANTGAVLVSYQTPSGGVGPSTVRVNRDNNGLLVAGGFDGGVGWGTNVGGFAPITPQPARTVDAEANMDCDHFGGYCYIVYVDRPAVASNDTNIFFRRSLGGGAWSAPVRANDDVGTNSQFNPAIDVDNNAGSTGDVSITWYDARNAGAANNTVQVWGTVLFYGNNWFWPNYRISNGTSSCITAGGFNCGDYDTGAFSNAVIYRSWTDNSNPSGLTPANATPPAQDMAMSRMRVDNRDVGGTIATAQNAFVGPAPCDYFHIVEPIGNDNDQGGGGLGRRDVDMYRIDANAGTTVTIRTHNPSGGSAMDTIIRLFNAAGGQLASNDDDEIATDFYSRLTFTFAVGGTYYVGISGFANNAYNPTIYGSGVDGSIGDYQLDISLTGRPDVGDTAAAALLVPIGPGVSSFFLNCEVIGNGVQNRRDVDMYRIQATAGQVLTAATFLPPGGDSGDTVLRIFNAGLVQVAVDDDAGPGLYSLVNYIVPVSGIYYVGVSAYSNFGYNPAVAGSGTTTNEILRLGDYQLYIGNMAQADVPDTLVTALNTGMGPGTDSYQLNWEVLGNGAFSNRDVDLYRFTANVGMRFTATTSLPPGANLSMDTIIRLFNSAGTEIAVNDDCVGFYSCITSFRIPATGTYTLGVSGYANFGYNPAVAGSGTEGDVGDYRLNMSLVPGPINNFLVTQSVATTTAGTPFSVTVRARDDGNNTITNYTGTVTFSTNEPSGGTLPANYMFVPGDNGVHIFTDGVTLYVAGTWNVTVAQVGSPGINGSVSHTVTPGPIYYFYIYPDAAAVTDVTQGVPFDVYLFPFDSFFNLIPDYVGEVLFYSPDPLSTMPPNYTWTGLELGVAGPFSVTFGTLGIQELYVFDVPAFTAFGYAQYNVLAPSGPTPGGQIPGAGDVADLLANAAQPAVEAVAARLDRPVAPALDAESVELLFARPNPIAPQEAIQQLVAQQRPAPVVERWSTLITDEIFQAV